MGRVVGAVAGPSAARRGAAISDVIRIAKPQAAVAVLANRQVERMGRIYHSRSAPLNTGPSVQASRQHQSLPIRGGFEGSGLRTRMQQLWHVPIPHAIARSTATWHSIPRAAAMSATRRIIGSGPQV